MIYMTAEELSAAKCLKKCRNPPKVMERSEKSAPERSFLIAGK